MRLRRQWGTADRGGSNQTTAVLAVARRLVRHRDVRAGSASPSTAETEGQRGTGAGKGVGAGVGKGVVAPGWVVGQATIVDLVPSTAYSPATPATAHMAAVPHVHPFVVSTDPTHKRRSWAEFGLPAGIRAGARHGLRAERTAWSPTVRSSHHQMEGMGWSAGRQYMHA